MSWSLRVAGSGQKLVDKVTETVDGWKFSNPGETAATAAIKTIVQGAVEDVPDALLIVKGGGWVATGGTYHPGSVFFKLEIESAQLV